MPPDPGPAPELVAITDYLLWARDAEENPWFRDDYQIAFQTCLNLGNGVAAPFVVACCETLGCHPDEVWERIVAQMRAKNGKYFREGLDDVTFHPHPELVAAWELKASKIVENQYLRKKPCRRVEFLPRRAA